MTTQPLLGLRGDFVASLRAADGRARKLDLARRQLNSATGTLEQRPSGYSCWSGPIS